MNELELRRLADAHRSDVSARLDVVADRAAVDARIAAGETGDDESAPARTWRSAWMVGAAASVVVLVAVGVLITRTDGGSIRTTPSPTDAIATDPSSAPPAVEPVPTTATSSEPTQTTSTLTASPSSTGVAPPAFTFETVSVDAADPPPMITPVVIASIPLSPNPDGNSISVAIGDNVIAVTQPDQPTVTLVDIGTGEPIGTRQVQLAEALNSIVIGPGDVLYGFGDVRLPPPPDQTPIFRYVAVALSGARQGQVLAESELGAVMYTELPPGVFGHGTDGVIDRERVLNADVIGYVDAQGLSTTWNDPPPMLLDSRQFDGDDRLVRVIGSELGWTLEINVAPDSGGTYEGPSPAAPTSGGRVVYSDNIGSDTTPGVDFGPNTMPVVAILEPDGSGRWVRLPEGWSVAASDVWGTVLARATDGALELALLDDALGI